MDTVFFLKPGTRREQILAYGVLRGWWLKRTFIEGNLLFVMEFLSNDQQSTILYAERDDGSQFFSLIGDEARTQEIGSQLFRDLELIPLRDV